MEERKREGGREGEGPIWRVRISDKREGGRERGMEGGRDGGRGGGEKVIWLPVQRLRRTLPLGGPSHMSPLATG